MEPINITAETLVAMMGMLPTRAPSEIELRGATVPNYEARIKRRLSSFLEAKKPGPIKWSRPPSQESLWRQLNEPIEPNDFNEWALDADLPLDVALQWPLLVKSARDYVLGSWPLYKDNSLGLHVYELAADEYGDVWHLFRTLNDPESIFDDLDSMLLLPVQVDAFKTIYPGLFASTQRLAALLIQPYIEIQGMQERKRWLSGEREEQFRILLQTEGDGPLPITQEEQQQEQQQEQGKPPSATQQSNRIDDSLTPMENIAEQRTARR